MLLLGAMTVIAVPLLLPLYAWEWSRQGGFDGNAANVAAIVAVALIFSGIYLTVASPARARPQSGN